MRVTDKVYNDIVGEAIRADEVHGINSMYYRHATDDRRLAILVEEVGEVANEVNEAHIHKDWSARREKLRKELVQVAAMAITWVQSLDDNPPR